MWFYRIQSANMVNDIQLNSDLVEAQTPGSINGIKPTISLGNWWYGDMLEYNYTAETKTDYIKLSLYIDNVHKLHYITLD